MASGERSGGDLFCSEKKYSRCSSDESGSGQARASAGELVGLGGFDCGEVVGRQGESDVASDRDGSGACEACARADSRVAEGTRFGGRGAGERGLRGNGNRARFEGGEWSCGDVALHAWSNAATAVPESAQNHRGDVALHAWSNAATAVPESAQNHQLDSKLSSLTKRVGF